MTGNEREREGEKEGIRKSQVTVIHRSITEIVSGSWTTRDYFLRELSITGYWDSASWLTLPCGNTTVFNYKFKKVATTNIWLEAAYEEDHASCLEKTNEKRGITLLIFLFFYWVGGTKSIGWTTDVLIVQ